MNNNNISELSQSDRVLITDLGQRYEHLASLTSSIGEVNPEYYLGSGQLAACNESLVRYRLEVFFGLDRVNRNNR